MVLAGSLEILGKINIQEIKAGLAAIKSDIAETVNSNKSLFAEMHRLQGTVSKLSTGFIALGAAGIAALTGILFATPELQPFLELLSFYFGEIARTIGKTLAPEIEFLTNAVKGALEFLKDNPAIAEFIGKLLLLGGALGVVGLAIKAFGLIFSPIITLLEFFAGRVIMGMVVPAIGSLVTAIAGILGITVGWAAVLVAAIAIIIAAIIAFIFNIGGFRDFVLNALGQVLSFFDNKFTRAIVDLIFSIIGFFVELGSGIADVLLAIIQVAGAWIAKFAGIIINGLIDIANWIASWPIVREILQVVGEITRIFTDLLGKAFDWGAKLIQGFADGIRSAGKWIGDALHGTAEWIRGFMPASSPAERGPMRNLLEWGKNFVKTFNEGIQLAIPQLQPSFALIGNPVSAPTSFGQSQSVVNDIDITINTGPISSNVDVRDLAEEVSRRVAENNSLRRKQS